MPQQGGARPRAASATLRASLLRIRPERVQPWCRPAAPDARAYPHTNARHCCEAREGWRGENTVRESGVQKESREGQQSGAPPASALPPQR